MTKYVVYYEMRKGNTTQTGSKAIECETEATAVRSAESQAKAQKPGYDFIIKKVEKKSQ